MDTMAITMPVAPPSAQGTQVQQTQAGEGSGFSKLLSGLQAQNDVGNQTKELSWRELQGLKQWNTLHSNTLQEKPASLEKLANILQDISANQPLAGELEPETKEQMLELINKLQQTLKELLEKNGQDGNLQLATLLMQLGQPMQMVLDVKGGQANQQDLQKMILALESFSEMPAEQILDMLLGALPQENLGQAKDLFEKLINFPQNLEPQKDGANQQIGKENAFSSELNIMRHQMPDAAQQQFSSTVRQVKEQLAEGDTQTDTEKEPLDIDALQKQVQTGSFLQGTAFAPILKPEIDGIQQQEPLPLANQVENGILKGLQEGQQQFSIKLMPEGLGELTIHMVKNSSGMSVSIIAKNAETQRMLAAEIDSLRQTLEPLQVQVESVLTEQQNGFLYSQQQFQQKQQQNWNEQTGQSLRKKTKGNFPKGIEALEQPAPPAQTYVLGNTVLDAYI